MEIRIRVRSANPLSGTAEAEDGEPVAFTGWVELLHVISALLGTPGAQGAPTDAPAMPGDGRREEDAS